jgi:hypothetical protein
LNSVCALGKTKIDNSTNLASLEVKVPQCYNGVLISNAKDYSETKYTISTNEENSADIILQKEYKFPLEIYVDGALTNENAVLLINEVDGNQTTFLDSINYPLTREIKLSQGVYNFELKVYKNGNIIIPATNNKQCLNQPKEGILGFFGVEEEKCYDVNLPSQTLTNLIYAGGNSNGAYTEDMLSGAETFRIDATSVKLPSNLEEIQTSSDSVENKKMIVSLV